jgi:hypothetical protein
MISDNAKLHPLPQSAPSLRSPHRGLGRGCLRILLLRPDEVLRDIFHLPVLEVTHIAFGIRSY